ncbi:hypothetical protein [Chryseobacterium sp. POE27]|uniref:hypothetical protein n=1 Tax=Chryseobacterium sp. POE27 TaxID=3138177 RepID=UPI00321AD379
MKKLNKHQNRLKIRDEKNILRKTYYSQFVALFYIRSTNIKMEKDVTEVLRMLKELQQLTNGSRLVFSTHCSLSKRNLWQPVLGDLIDNIKYLRIQFEYIRENSTKKNRINSLMFWQQNEIYVHQLEEIYKKLIQLAFQILPKEERLSWKTTICNFYDEIFSLLIPLTVICRLESDFLEKYSPKIFDKAVLDIIKRIPEDYTLQEAREYEHEYLKLTKYSQESGKKNNFWDSLLYILSGGLSPLPPKLGPSKRSISRKMKDKLTQ